MSFCNPPNAVFEPCRTTFPTREEAIRGAQDKKCTVITHTYTEPSISFEYTRDVSALAGNDAAKWVLKKG